MANEFIPEPAILDGSQATAPKGEAEPSAALALLLIAALVLSGCRGGSGETARGFALAAGYRDVTARLTQGSANIDDAACDKDSYLYAFTASNGVGLICAGGKGARFLARSDVAVSPAPISKAESR